MLIDNLESIMLGQLHLLTSKVWHVYSLEQMAWEQSSQVADVEYGLQETGTHFSAMRSSTYHRH